MKNTILILISTSLFYAGCHHEEHGGSGCRVHHTCPPPIGTIENDTISYDTAKAYVDHFAKRHDLEIPLGFHLDKAFLMTFLADSNVDGINVYNGVKGDNESAFIVTQSKSDSLIGRTQIVYPTCLMMYVPCKPRCYRMGPSVVQQIIPDRQECSFY